MCLVISHNTTITKLTKMGAGREEDTRLVITVEHKLDILSYSSSILLLLDTAQLLGGQICRISCRKDIDICVNEYNDNTYSTHAFSHENDYINRSTNTFCKHASFKAGWSSYGPSCICIEKLNKIWI